MNTTELETLKTYANRFYLGINLELPELPDKVYDELVHKYEAEGGSVKDLVDWDPEMRRPNKPLPKVDKTQVTDNNLDKAASEYLTNLALRLKNGGEFHYALNYKYDGSSIIAYYTPEGKLQMILGTPDQELCMDRTRNCWNFFPHQVTPGIECIQGEFLVDASQYGELARNKANGLLNSKDMLDEIENEGFIRAYQMRFYDDNWTFDRLQEELKKLPVITSTRIRNGETKLDRIFSAAEVLTSCPTTSIIRESYAGYSDVDFQVDGVVAYHSFGYHALKFYFTESAITTVTQVQWNLQNNGGYSCKIVFEPIVLNGKNISQASSGGVPNLMWMKMGKSAKIRVILANMTIPKIVETLEPSEDYEWPKCGCGYQMSEKDIVGSTLKCHAEFCSQKYDLWKDNLNPWKDLEGNELRAAIIHDKFAILDSVLNIDRWGAANNFILMTMDSSLTSEEHDKCFEAKFLYDLIVGNLEDFKRDMKVHFRFTWSCQQIFDANVGTAYKLLVDTFRDKLKDDKAGQEAVEKLDEMLHQQLE